MPRLSVLMPARNASGTIGRALHSTLAALPRDAEVLVLDDASTDNTFAVASAIGDPRVAVLAAPEHLGVARGGQLLLERASGEFVARIDADDITVPGRFRAQLAAIERGADLVFTTFQVIGGGPRKPVPPIAFSSAAATLALLLDCPYPHSTMLARAASLHSVGGYRDAVAEDYDLWLRVAASGARLARLARPGILLRVSPTQVTANPRWRSALGGDPMLIDAYGELAERLWRTRSTPWLPHLSFARVGPLSGAGRAELEPFVGRFTASLGALPPAQAWSLARRARQELGKRIR